jgi:hypothetical protein
MELKDQKPHKNSSALIGGKLNCKKKSLQALLSINQ